MSWFGEPGVCWDGTGFEMKYCGNGSEVKRTKRNDRLHVESMFVGAAQLNSLRYRRAGLWDYTVYGRSASKREGNNERSVGWEED